MKLLHWYYDIMNLYGEYGNIAALQRLFTRHQIDCTVDRLSFGDKVPLDTYDFIYIGSGTEKNRNVVMQDMLSYQTAWKELLSKNIPILLTGNAFEMLGQHITDAHNVTHQGLGLFDFTVREQNKTRLTADAIFTADFSDKPFIGFINKCSEITGIDTPLFHVQRGLGNRADDPAEGLLSGQLYGTHLTGPILIKNPHFLLWVARQILGDNTALSDTSLLYETAAYEHTLTKLSE